MRNRRTHRRTVNLLAILPLGYALACGAGDAPIKAPHATAVQAPDPAGPRTNSSNPPNQTNSSNPPNQVAVTIQKITAIVDADDVAAIKNMETSDLLGFQLDGQDLLTYPATRGAVQILGYFVDSGAFDYKSWDFQKSAEAALARGKPASVAILCKGYGHASSSKLLDDALTRKSEADVSTLVDLFPSWVTHDELNKAATFVTEPTLVRLLNQITAQPSSNTWTPAISSDLADAAFTRDFPQVLTVLAGNSSLNIDKLSLIYKAAAAGSLNILKNLLAANPAIIDVPETSDGRTPLHIAIVNGKVAVVDYLLAQSGVSLLKTDASHANVFHLAAMSPNSDALGAIHAKYQQLQADGTIPTTTDMLAAAIYPSLSSDLALNPYQVAAAHDQVSFLKFFQEKTSGTMAKAKDSQGNTLLHIAAYYGSPASVDWLLDVLQIDAMSVADRTTLLTNNAPSTGSFEASVIVARNTPLHLAAKALHDSYGSPKDQLKMVWTKLQTALPDDIKNLKNSFGQLASDLL